MLCGRRNLCFRLCKLVMSDTNGSVLLVKSSVKKSLIEQYVIIFENEVNSILKCAVLSYSLTL